MTDDIYCLVKILQKDERIIAAVQFKIKLFDFFLQSKQLTDYIYTDIYCKLSKCIGQTLCFYEHCLVLKRKIHNFFPRGARENVSPGPPVAFDVPACLLVLQRLYAEPFGRTQGQPRQQPKPNVEGRYPSILNAIVCCVTASAS